MLVIVAAVVAGLVLRDRLATPALDPSAGLVLRVEPFQNASAIEILDDRGNSLHRFVLNGFWDPVIVGRHVERVVAFGDLDGDGFEDAVVARSDRPPTDPVEIYLRRPDGSFADVLSYPATSGFEYEGENFDAFQPADVHTTDLDGDGRAEIVLVENSTGFYPAAVRVLNWEGETLFTLWHPGVLTSAQTADRDGDGSPELYIGGTCNFLTPPESDTSKPVVIALERDWRHRGDEVDLFGPQRRLPSTVPAGSRLMYMAWERVVTLRYLDSWQSALVTLGPTNDPETFLSVIVSDANPTNLGLEVRKRLAIRYAVIDPELRIGQTQWEPMIINILGINPAAPEMQALLRPRYSTGEGWSEQQVFLAESTP